MSRKSLFVGSEHLPLLNSRDLLIVLEILSFAFRIFPEHVDSKDEVVVYKNKYRTCNMCTFRKEVLYTFSSELFTDILLVLKPLFKIVELVNHEITRRVARNYYNSHQLNRGIHFLDAAILVYCLTLDSWSEEFLSHVVWTDKEQMYWRLYFAKLLIEHG